MKGFSYRNLKYIRQWYLSYNQENIIGETTCFPIRNDSI